MIKVSPGCKERKCPCRMWINCSTYVDATRQQNRLKKKEYKESIKHYYDNTFKLQIGMPDVTVNG